MNWESFRRLYSLKLRGTFIYIAIALAFLVIIAVISPFFGEYPVSVSDVFKIIIGHITGNPIGGRTDFVVWDVRLTVTVMAIIIGAVLGVAGSVMQATMKNPLADPYTIGISSGALLGATLSITMGITIVPGLTGNTATIVNAFLLSLIPTAVIMVLSFFRNLSSTMMILAGIAVMYFFSAASSYMMLIASPAKLSEVYEWNLGHFPDGYWDAVMPLLIPSVVGLVLLYLLTKRVDLLSCSDEIAHSSGINPARTRILIMVIVSFTVAVVVSFSGTIGFVGLVIPHICRMFINNSQKYMVPASAITGAALMVIASIIARDIGGIPVGLITTLIGCPVFLALLMRQHRIEWC